MVWNPIPFLTLNNSELLPIVIISPVEKNLKMSGSLSIQKPKASITYMVFLCMLFFF